MDFSATIAPTSSQELASESAGIYELNEPVTILEILTLSSVRVTETSTVGQRLGCLTFQADEYIRQSLLDPAAFVVPGFSSIMPKFSFFTDAQILALTESLKSL